ncbi:hypothetical protein FZ029_28390 [Azospirillum sp. Sh1]|nr:hypothetical protein FZ029_28390 [Azospirillum sp. Sh1]
MQDQAPGFPRLHATRPPPPPPPPPPPGGGGGGGGVALRASPKAPVALPPHPNPLPGGERGLETRWSVP